jgi:ATP:corrinoid adenosyltransferase
MVVDTHVSVLMNQLISEMPKIFCRKFNFHLIKCQYLLLFCLDEVNAIIYYHLLKWGQVAHYNAEDN